MFRATLLIVVVMLAVGQDVALLCSSCHQSNASAASCQHQDSVQSPRVTGNDDCDAVPVAIAVIRDNDWRDPAPEARNALVVPRFRFVPSATDLPFRDKFRHRLPLNSPPLTALRL